MSTAEIEATIVAHNHPPLLELKRAMALRPHRFSLILARCNYTRLQSILAHHLRQTIPVVEVALPAATRNLRPVLERGAPIDTALMVTGLEQVREVEALFKAANLGRDEFSKAFPFPVVLWVNDLMLTLLNRHAPDFKSFAAAPIRFTYPTAELIRSLHQNANDLFATMLSLGDDSPYPDCTPSYQPGSILRTELEFALADLASIPAALDGELAASLNFLQGRDALSRGALDLAHYYFDQSLTYWQDQAAIAPETPPFHHPLVPTTQQKQAILLFYLGVTWRSWAAVQRIVYRQLLDKAQVCFAACLEIFRGAGQMDWVGKFLHPLAEVRQKLEDWPGLATIAQEGLTLHRGDAVRLARDHGYLAEVAVAQNDWATAQAEATQALDILKIASVVEAVEPQLETDGLRVANRYQRGWYLYLLAQTQIAQGQGPGAIALLEEAHQQTHPKSDLSLYRRILETLRQQYYNHQDYWAAFQVKLEQRQVDTQFKLRAFLGASPIQPYEATPGVPGSQRTIAPEIEASGRRQDVEALIGRLEQPRYPLITLHGPSGVGKSSILNGGLIPALAQSFPEGRTTVPMLITTYRDWLETTNQAVERSLKQQGDPELAIALPVSTEIDPSTLLTRLKVLTDRHYRQIILLFDQFEELFTDLPEFSQRREFYAFLVDCLKAPYIKLVLALREDYLHYLLEIEREFDLDIINNDILSRDQRYYLGDFQVEDAKTLIRSLTHDVHFYLEETLIDQLVNDLSEATQRVKPIELQVVGAQLQRDGIDTLEAYRQLGPHPKETLVQRFLSVVVDDCGPENALLARRVLYLLTDVDRDKRLYRPQKSQEDLEEELTLRGAPYTDEQLDLVLEVLVGSGLVFWIPDVPINRYQLVHDYLMSYVRENPALDFG